MLKDDIKSDVTHFLLDNKLAYSLGERTISFYWIFILKMKSKLILGVPKNYKTLHYY